MSTTLPDLDQTLRIGQLADRGGVGVETVRFYEREGLLEEPPRRSSGYRAYPPESVTRLRFIRQAKELGFTLREIRDLLELRVDSNTPCGDVRERIREKVQDIDERIDSLKRVRRALEELASQCEGEPVASDCPFLEALDSPGGGS